MASIHVLDEYRGPTSMQLWVKVCNVGLQHLSAATL